MWAGTKLARVDLRVRRAAYDERLNLSVHVMETRGGSAHRYARLLRWGLYAPLPDGRDCQLNGEESPFKCGKELSGTPEAGQCIKLV